MSYRIGLGWDNHRLVSGRPLVLAGLNIPSELGELGHSDGDVLFHALTDAMLGSIAAGDIGMHFPPSDPKWKDAASVLFVKKALDILESSGFSIVNIDATIILEKPRLRDFIDSIRAAIASVVKIPVAEVSVKAKTKEGMDAAGRLEAIEAQVVVLVKAGLFASRNA